MKETFSFLEKVESSSRRHILYGVAALIAPAIYQLTGDQHIFA
jgi:hypothetical protein